MGYEYYLVREDTRELFEIGKFYGARDAFAKVPGCTQGDQYDWRNPMRFCPLDANALARDLSAVVAEGYWDFKDDADRDDYCARLAKEIVRWADGHEVAFVGESHPWIEEFDSEYRKPEPERDGDWYRRLNITGSRYM